MDAELVNLLEKHRTELSEKMESNRNYICAEIGKLHKRSDGEIKTNQTVKTNLDNHLKGHVNFNTANKKNIQVETNLTNHLNNHKTKRTTMYYVGVGFSGVVTWIVSKIPDGFWIHVWASFR